MVAKPQAHPAALVRVGADAAIANAKRLLRDAEILAAAGSPASSRSLSILAMEEAAKARIWWRLSEEQSGTVTLDAEHHVPRLSEVRQTFSYLDAFTSLMDDPEAPVIGEEEEAEAVALAAKLDNEAKQRGFYVDLGDGKVIAPTDVSRDEAEQMLKLASLYVHMTFELGSTGWDESER